MDKAVLLKGYLPEDDVVLPSGLGTVHVRGLSRQEAIGVAKIDDEQEMERVACSLGMLDPAMSAVEVGEWQKVGVAADLQAVATKISDLSNMAPGSGKGRTSTSRAIPKRNTSSS